ncbi:MAG: hypothetical protein P4L22_00805 [Candidatus Babeliales bacterium]|nr:hypothetical protein [Candidatus Babeliales bacterium]
MKRLIFLVLLPVLISAMQENLSVKKITIANHTKYSLCIQAAPLYQEMVLPNQTIKRDIEGYYLIIKNNFIKVPALSMKNIVFKKIDINNLSRQPQIINNFVYYNAATKFRVNLLGQTSRSEHYIYWSNWLPIEDSAIYVITKEKNKFVMRKMN